MVLGPGGTPQPAEDFSLYPPEVLLAMSDYLDKLADRAQRREREAYERGYSDGRTDASIFSALIYEDEQAEAHWTERRLMLMELSRDVRFCGDAKRKKPFQRTYEEMMALAMREDHLRIAPVQTPVDDDWHPHGCRA